jgi:hypothetical protein
MFVGLLMIMAGVVMINLALFSRGREKRERDRARILYYLKRYFSA